MITVVQILQYGITCRPGACISLKEYMVCLPVCVIAHSGYTDNSKPIFLFLDFFLENTVCLCGSCLSPSLSTEVLLVKLLLKQLQSARQFENRLVVLNHCRLT